MFANVKVYVDNCHILYFKMFLVHCGSIAPTPLPHYFHPLQIVQQWKSPVLRCQNWFAERLSVGMIGGHVPLIAQQVHTGTDARFWALEPTYPSQLAVYGTYIIRLMYKYNGEEIMINYITM